MPAPAHPSLPPRDGANQGGQAAEGPRALSARQQALTEIDVRGILATPANSYINELVTEAARLSIAQNGQPVEIQYEPRPMVRPCT